MLIKNKEAGMKIRSTTFIAVTSIIMMHQVAAMQAINTQQGNLQIKTPEWWHGNLEYQKKAQLNHAIEMWQYILYVDNYCHYFHYLHNTHGLRHSELLSEQDQCKNILDHLQLTGPEIIQCAFIAKGNNLFRYLHNALPLALTPAIKIALKSQITELNTTANSNPEILVKFNDFQTPVGALFTSLKDLEDIPQSASDGDNQLFSRIFMPPAITQQSSCSIQ